MVGVSARPSFFRQLLKWGFQPVKSPAAVWRAWKFYPRRLKWLMWFVSVAWPKFLGGLATTEAVIPNFYDGWPPGYHAPPGNPETQPPPAG